MQKDEDLSEKMSSPFPILYLEDDYNDACILAKMINDIFKEYGEKDSIQFHTAKDVLEYLSAKGIDWTENYEQFKNRMEQQLKLQEYKLFLIDMKMGGVSPMCRVG